MNGNLVNGELERMRKAAMPHFEVLSQHLPGGIEKIHEKLQLLLPVCERIFEPGTSGIRSRSANDSSGTFGCYVLEDSVY
jgi:hypothetical protein